MLEAVRHPVLRLMRIKMGPLTLEGLAGKPAGRGEPFVVFDENGAGVGSRIAVSEGAEAAAPFYPETKPIDAYNAAILDTIEFEQLK